MIIVKANFIDNTASPSDIPNTDFGSHFDGEKYYYFENEIEKNEFYYSLNSIDPIL